MINFRILLSFLPIDTFMITDIVNPIDFYHRAINNLFFDRCRIMNYAENIKECDWYESLIKWTTAVLNLYKIQ